MEKTVKVRSHGRMWSSENRPIEITISGKAYIVVEHAVYNHSIFGPFATRAQANRAVKALDAASDGHHDYSVCLLKGVVE